MRSPAGPCMTPLAERRTTVLAGRGLTVLAERGMTALASAAIFVLAFLILTPPAGAQNVGLPEGAEAPPANLEDLDGNPVSLLDHIGNGTPALLEFWATWCGQCRLLQPKMDQVQATYGDRLNIMAVAVAVSQTPAQVRRHLEEHDPGYPFLWDGRGEAVRNYNIPGTGVILLFDGDGRVVYNGTGGDQDLMGAVERLLGP